MAVPLEILCWTSAASLVVLDYLLEHGQNPFEPNEMVPDPHFGHDIEVSDCHFSAVSTSNHQVQFYPNLGVQG